MDVLAIGIRPRGSSRFDVKNWLGREGGMKAKRCVENLSIFSKEVNARRVQVSAGGKMIAQFSQLHEN